MVLCIKLRLVAEMHGATMHVEIINISMQTIADILVVSVLTVFLVVVFCFAVTGACLVGSSQPVFLCRDNVAGQVTYEVVSLVI